MRKFGVFGYTTNPNTLNKSLKWYIVYICRVFKNGYVRINATLILFKDA